MANANEIMEAIQSTAEATASSLKETLFAQTVDFIVHTSLHILPLDRRTHVHIRDDFEQARRREKQFNFIMRYLASAFVKNNEKIFEGGQKTMVSALRHTDEDSVTRFTKLMQVWKSDRANTMRTVVDDQARPSESLKSLFVSASSKPDMVGTWQRSRNLETGSTGLQHFQGPQKVGGNFDLAKALRNVSIQPKTSSQNHKTLSKPQPVQSPQPPNIQQQPCEANAFGVETRDGVLIGHPPKYPPGLLDWESPEDNEEFEELVSNRRARVAAQTPASTESDRTHREEADNSKISEDLDLEADDEWVCV